MLAHEEFHPCSSTILVLKDTGDEVTPVTFSETEQVQSESNLCLYWPDYAAGNSSSQAVSIVDLSDLSDLSANLLPETFCELLT